jgi:hypothetical protein
MGYWEHMAFDRVTYTTSFVKIPWECMVSSRIPVYNFHEFLETISALGKKMLKASKLFI